MYLRDCGGLHENELPVPSQWGIYERLRGVAFLGGGASLGGRLWNSAEMEFKNKGRFQCKHALELGILGHMILDLSRRVQE